MGNENKVENEEKQKLKELKENHIFWEDKALTQLGFTTNLFTTIGIAILGYFVSIRKDLPTLYFCSNAEIHWGLCLYVLSSVLIAISVFYGIFCITSRLWDFRLTRHLALYRKKFFNDKTEDVDAEIVIDVSNIKKIKNFFKIICKDIDFIKENEIKQKEVFIHKYKKIKEYTEALGKTTWSTYKRQVMLFLSGTIIYGLSILIN